MCQSYHSRHRSLGASGICFDLKEGRGPGPASPTQKWMEMLFTLVLRVGYSEVPWVCQEELKRMQMCNGVVQHLEVSK